MLMSTSLNKCFFLVICFVTLDAEVYTDRPRIKTNNGHLVLEPAADKNIYFQTNGPKSTIFVGGVNLLQLNVTDVSRGQYQPSSSDVDVNGLSSIFQRLDRLESRFDTRPDLQMINVSILWRRTNRLATRLTRLEALINRMGEDHCQSRPCLNGGTCLSLANGYHCLCPSNWEGKDCDVDVNECRIYQGTDLGCQNGAFCKNTPGDYECQCTAGWYGVHCTRRSKDCAGGNFEMCGHGTCIPTNSGQGIKCICDQGWTTNGTGEACHTDVNECESSQGPRCSVNPRVECINLPGSFRCGQCPPGYEGDGYVCSDIDECLTISNGGCSTSPLVTCHNTVGSRICGPCPTGYQGDGITCTWRGSCNINRGGCHPSAQCIENSALGGQVAQCVCPLGMEGDGIGLHGCYVPTGNSTRACDSNPCGSNGQCHPLRAGYTCICYRGYVGSHCVKARDFCMSNPCLNGGICRPDEVSPRGFRCECTAQYSGDLCHVPVRSCGGFVRAEEGSIVYPLNNTSYNNNVRCAWVINTDPNKVINVTFSKFNLESDPECSYDFLQIHDGSSAASQIIGRFCGNSFPKGGNIISSHNKLYFWFRSDQTVSKDGFALHWNSINPVCGGEISIDATNDGHISSPGSPGKYPPNRDCYWHLSTTLGKRIQLHFYSLDIEAHSNCSFDFVAIYDGAQTSDPLIAKYCNSTQPAPVTSAGSDVLVYFHSDGQGSGQGFQMVVTSREGVPGCGGLYTTDKGEISSPSYDGKYLSGLICEYKIKTTPDTKIRLTFKTFELEPSFRCKYDYIKIYDGPSEEYPLVGRFCGRTFPKSYTSTTNQLYIKFNSDQSLAGEGFRINYETVCQYTIIGDSGVIKSPGYPFSYPKNRVCEYLIGTALGKAIQLSFQDFDIEDNNYYNCRYDNIEIRDGVNINATLLGKYCGGTEYTPPTITSTHNYLYMKFTSDLSISGTGFYANFTTIDIECGGIYRETTGLISHPSGDYESYSNDQHCVWMIIAPGGMIIKLTWNRFDLENMPSCTSDYVMIQEVDENNENNNLGKYCGTNMPPALTTSTNQLQIIFQSDSSVKSGGFSVSYTFLDEKTHCGGSYTKAHGFIYSPGWPKRYPNNRDCTWNIQAPNGQQIILNITQFHLEQPIRGQCDYGDYLEIRNGASQSSPMIGKYCGQFQMKVIKSLSNSIYLHFHSDSYITGNGFKIEWDSTISGCGGTLSSPSGSISSPNYPLNYNDNAECFYKIVTSHGGRVQLRFTDIDLERTHNCRDDYVEIFDGRDENAQSLGKFCHPNNEIGDIKSSTNYVFIKFRSDFFRGGKGFLLEYNTVCVNNITGLYGTIESPGYPGPFPSNLKCLWTINVPKGNRINVTFTDFDVPVSRHPMYRHRDRIPIHSDYSQSGIRNSYYWDIITSCDLNFLQLKDSSETNFGEKLCGTQLPARMSSRGNSLEIKFVTTEMSYYFIKGGFRLEWAIYGCGGYIQKSFGEVRIDSALTSRGELECEWVIETPQGTSVTFNVLDLYMTDTKNCTTDAIEIYNGRTTNTPLLTKICHRGNNGVITSFSTTSNFMLVKFVKQSSLKDVFFTAHFSSYRSTCGGRIEALSGIIHSKNYPQNYDNDMNCMWSLVVPRYHRIELQFMDFDLYSRSNDDIQNCGDYINIYDGDLVLNSNYTTRICPQTEVASPIISKNNILGVQFLTDYDGTAKGFKANFTVICGATIKALYDGIIANDKWHATNIVDNCTWTILAPSLDQKISLTVTHLSIRKDSDIITNRKCPSSFLRVYDGDDSNAPLLEEYCGRKIPPMIVSKGSALTLVFGAYNGSAQGQFAVHYTPMTSACGGILTSEEGSIASPNYPLSYPNNASCEWVLNTSPGNKVYITFEQFDLEWSENCNEDYLEVREENGGGTLLGVYCGSDIPSNTTTASKLYLKFHSNNENSGRGFVLHYGFLHGNEINGLERGEIASPLYPYHFDGSGEYSWRIITEGSKTISLVVDRYDIPTQGSTCYNSLTFYDGYDEEAPVIEEICGILQNIKELQTTSNIAYIKLKLDESNSGSIFHISWTNADKSAEPTDQRTNCGFNETEVLSPGKKITFTSPGFPEIYNEDLYCEWVFQASPGHHVNLHFKTFQIEETPMCFADSVSIYSSNTPSLWRPVKENICLLDDVKKDFNSSNYMKVVFKTDASIERKGFEGEVTSICGGFLSGLSGTIEPSYEDFQSLSVQKCEWTIKVRPGRMVLLNFEHFNITNNNDCAVYVTLRNGDSIEAPMLADGKYCGLEHEKRTDISSSSNAVFVVFKLGYHYSMRSFVNFRLRYEEKGTECGLSSKLDSDHKWEIVNSPNYPSVPTPYSECIWTFSAPPGEILRIDFMDRFDLERKKDCLLEYVEIRDGSTDISPLKGRYCKDIPSTIKTSGNVVYIKYYTQLAEPRNGFKANVSIDTCGGTIISSKGEVTSPGYPHLQSLPYGTVCEWRIVGPPRFTLFIKPQDIQLPDSVTPCDTKITIQETESFNNTVVVLASYCSGDENMDMLPIQSSSNELRIILRIGRPSEWTQSVSNRGFRFTFNASRPTCGGEVTTPEGYLTTPGYPRETTMRYCQWRIVVPDKTRRVRLELLDSNSESHRIGIYNDLSFQTKILSASDSPDATNVYESSGNTMAVYLLLDSVGSRHRFKARFSSAEAALCGGDLSGTTGELLSPDLDVSYACEWKYRPNSSTNITSSQTLYVTAKVNSSMTRSFCSFSDPHLNIQSISARNQLFYTKQLCGNLETSLRIPSSVMQLKANKQKGSSLYFHLEWKLNPCGGVIEVSRDEINLLNIPDNYNDTLDCAWWVVVPFETRVQIKLEGSFQLDCDNEFVKISQGYDDKVPLIGDYCKDKMQDVPLTTPYKFMFVQYHSNVKTDTHIRLMVNTITDHCGGVLTDYDHIFESPNYPHQYDANIECTWEIKSNMGNRISLRFIERFSIEDQTNCSKDAVIIYDWKNDEWVQIGRVCGRSLPPTFTSSFSRMKVVLRTDATTQLDGFKAQWIPICGGQFNATNKEQFLYSPGNPYMYLPDMNCTYEITGGENKVLITFLEFTLEGNYPSCEFDNLTITAFSDEHYLDEIYCGSQIPIVPHYFKKVTITFKSDSYIQRKGFKLSFQLYTCGGEVKEPKVIRSHSGSEIYDSNENCTWIIEAPKDKIVVVKFQDIDLESSTDCYADYLAVFNGKLIDDDKRIALICGHVASPTMLRSIGNTMVVQFISDFAYGKKGFKFAVYFSYSPKVGCGGEVDLNSLSLGAFRTFKSPLFNSSVVYENFLDCRWNIKAPIDYSIKIKFNKFHIAPCSGVNQTAIGYTKCDCDYVEIIDGVNPNDIVMNKFCGYSIPEELVTTGNLMSVRLYTDGEEVSAGFEAELSLQRPVCGQTMFTLSSTPLNVKSPGFASGSIPRGLSCVYHFDTNNDNFHLIIKHFDLRPGYPDPNQCNKDKLLIVSVPEINNSTFGNDLIINNNGEDYFFYNSYISYESDLRLPDRYEYCGVKSNFSLYLSGSVSIYLMTSSESDSTTHKGIEMEVVKTGNCGRNYTELQGRIRIFFYDHEEPDDCYILITVPENYTISAYFLEVSTRSWDVNDIYYLDVFDGDKTSSPKLLTTKDDSEGSNAPVVFSTGRNLLFHKHIIYPAQLNYDLIYMATDKGRGCGGSLHSLLGKVTSPLYPETYRKVGSCEWEIETPANTRVRLHFPIFDLGRVCDTNYVQLVDRTGNPISTYCEEPPAVYMSPDNYVKIVFTTTRNNGGTGWVANFVAVVA